MKILKFTRPDGDSVWIAPAWIVSVSRMSGLNRQTRIRLSGEIQDVKETIEEVIADIAAE